MYDDASSCYYPCTCSQECDSFTKYRHCWLALPDGRCHWARDGIAIRKSCNVQPTWPNQPPAGPPVKAACSDHKKRSLCERKGCSWDRPTRVCNDPAPTDAPGAPAETIAPVPAPTVSPSAQKTCAKNGKAKPCRDAGCLWNRSGSDKFKTCNADATAAVSVDQTQP